MKDLQTMSFNETRLHLFECRRSRSSKVSVLQKSRATRRRSRNIQLAVVKEFIRDDVTENCSFTDDQFIWRMADHKDRQWRDSESQTGALSRQKAQYQLASRLVTFFCRAFFVSGAFAFCAARTLHSRAFLSHAFGAVKLWGSLDLAAFQPGRTRSRSATTRLGSIRFRKYSIGRRRDSPPASPLQTFFRSLAATTGPTLLRTLATTWTAFAGIGYCALASRSSQPGDWDRKGAKCQREQNQPSGRFSRTVRLQKPK